MKLRTPFGDLGVAAAFECHPEPVRARLLGLRELIFEVARETDGVGEVEEALRWGQPSYLTARPKSGTPIRLGAEEPSSPALYVHCQTDLIERFRDVVGDDLEFRGNRAIVFPVDMELPLEPLRTFVAAALTYHADRSRRASRRR